MKVAFDVDGTLIDYTGKPRDDIIAMLVTLSNYCDVYVWSGGGIDYARHIGNRLNLPESVRYIQKQKGTIDICFDDQHVLLASKNIYVEANNGTE
jgi:hydroxymethylpyrimidine pyrophosphatase-like HAD family hydrolase